MLATQRPAYIANKKQKQIKAADSYLQWKRNNCVKWVREKDGTLTMLRNGEFIVNVTETEKPLFSQWWENVQN